MSLVPSVCASDISTAYADVVQFPPIGDYPSAFATAYDDYTALGIVPGAVNTGGVLSIIDAAVRAAPTTPELLGLALAQYWATVALVPVAPYVTSINNALTLVPLFILSIENSLTTVKSDPEFLDFIQHIEDVVKTIIWTLTDGVGGQTFVGIT